MDEHNNGKSCIDCGRLTYNIEGRCDECKDKLSNNIKIRDTKNK